MSRSSYLGFVFLGFAYFFIVIFPYLIFGFSFIRGIISYPDLIDLLFYPPVIGLTIYYIFKNLENKKELIEYLFILLLIIHFVGHGFHWAANAIDVTIEEIGTGTPNYIASYAYFLDEFLSHKIMYLSVIAILLLVQYIAKDSEFDVEKKILYIGEVSSFIFGFSFMISFIEGQSPYEALIFGILIIVLSFIYLRNINDIYKRTIIRYLFNLAIWILIWGTLYYALFKGFPQPSEWM